MVLFRIFGILHGLTNAKIHFIIYWAEVFEKNSTLFKISATFGENFLRFMEKEQIVQQVFQVFETILKHQNFTSTEMLSGKNIAGYDSMAQINIIAELEKNFNIRFQLKELAKMTSVDSIVEIIQEKLP